MPSSDKPKAKTEIQDAERFKAVVKRLLDTPPTHKPAKKPVRSQAPKKRREQKAP